MRVDRQELNVRKLFNYHTTEFIGFKIWKQRIEQDNLAGILMQILKPLGSSPIFCHLPARQTLLISKLEAKPTIRTDEQYINRLDIIRAEVWKRGCAHNVISRIAAMGCYQDTCHSSVAIETKMGLNEVNSYIQRLEITGEFSALTSDVCFGKGHPEVGFGTQRINIRPPILDHDVYLIE